MNRFVPQFDTAGVIALMVVAGLIYVSFNGICESERNSELERQRQVYRTAEEKVRQRVAQFEMEQDHPTALAGS